MFPIGVGLGPILEGIDGITGAGLDGAGGACLCGTELICERGAFEAGTAPHADEGLSIHRKQNVTIQWGEQPNVT